MELAYLIVNFVLLRNVPGEAEVANLDLAVLIHEDVGWLEVSMDQIG